VSRPALLIIDPDDRRRYELGQGLAAAEYEVVPAVDFTEGARFANGLASAVIVAPSDLPQVADGSLLSLGSGLGSGRQHSIVLLGTAPAEAEQLPDEVIFLATGGMEIDQVVARLQLVLTGHEIGIEVDTKLEALVGDLALLPLLELLRDLGNALITCRVELERGVICFERGLVVAARTSAVSGRKAVCRLSRLSEGRFRVVLAPPEVDREIGEEVDSLIVAAIEDSVGEFPDLRTRIEIEIGPSFFARQPSPLQQEIITAAHKGTTLQEVLDTTSESDGKVVQELLRLAEQGIAVLTEPMPAVHVITDSTCDLPAHIVREHGIEVVPLTVSFGKQAFREGIELKPREFYRLLEQKQHHPSSSPPEPGDFSERYLAKVAARDIVSVHISSRLSVTLEQASKGAASVDLAAVKRPASAAGALELVDSRSVSLGLGLLTLFAARMAARGETAPAIADRLRQMSKRFHVLFVVNTLEYLVRGGRIGKARGWIGQLLGIKPILGLVDGEVVPVDKVRGGRAAHPRIIELMSEHLDPERPLIGAIMHAKAPVWADRLRGLVKRRFQVIELMTAEMGAVVGTHAGPGTVGLFAFQPSDEEMPLIAPLDRR
jgi:DegV family protein with EDD domain